MARRTVLRQVKRDETSPRVAFVHQALAAMGYPVAKEEATRARAGASTERRLKELREKFGVPEAANPFDQQLVDAVTGELDRRGLTDTKRAFTVAGVVRDARGVPTPRQRLLAFDLDLRGVRARRDASNLADLAADHGFEPLGETVSDPAGTYTITFYDWQYASAERGTADVVVYAVDEHERLAGSSRIAATRDFSDTGLARGLDVRMVVLDLDDRTEFARVHALLDPFLEESKVELHELSGAGEEIAFTARELELTIQLVAAATDASVLAAALKPGGAREVSNAELLYGLARGGVQLSWPNLYQRNDDDLEAAIRIAAQAKLIRRPTARSLRAFLNKLRAYATERIVSGDGDEGVTLDKLLEPVLPKPAQRAAYARATAEFTGDAKAFWTEHLPAQEEFRDKPELVEGARVLQQLTALTAGHRPLVQALTAGRGIRSRQQLLALSSDELADVVREAGVPGIDAPDDEVVERYAAALMSRLDTAFPTERVASLVMHDGLGLDPQIAEPMGRFLADPGDFSIAGSRVSDFADAIKDVAGDHAEDVSSELKKLQRVFQVSSSPDTMQTLLDRGLDSAHAIASIPRKAFLAEHGEAVGGEAIALALHERSSHISARTLLTANKMQDYANGHIPWTVLGGDEQTIALEAIEAVVPNFANLIGSPDLCECAHCRSIYGPAAYLVELLRFLWRGTPSDDGDTPLDVFQRRRPDVLTLPLTCENSNTLLPYLDLANEVMEYYAAAGSLAAFEGHDTGDATEAELRASPQHTNLEAYRTLAGEFYPFTLPYHLPLDILRTHSDQLGVSRYDVMRAVHPTPAAATARATAAERLRLSEREYELITGKNFAGAASAITVHEAFGLATAADLESLREVRELMHRTGVNYLELVDLIQTRFINPGQDTLEHLEALFARAPADAATLYDKLSDVAAGALDPAADPVITAALAAYNVGRTDPLTAAALGAWLTAHFDEFRAVVTLFEPNSRCDPDTTELRSIARIYEGGAGSGVTAATWTCLHRLIRLWRRLGVTIHETDVVLTGLGVNDLDPDAIAALEHVLVLKEASRLGIDVLATLWGSIDTAGDRSLYRKLFLNRAVQRIDPVFQPDATGAYLSGPPITLAAHRPALLAAFHLREEELDAIMEVARVLEGGVLRPIDIAADPLDLPALSTIHRHVVLAKALKLRVRELCAMLTALDAAPFSVWDIDAGAWTSIDTRETREFYELASAYKAAGMGADELAYVIHGDVPESGRLGLADDDIASTARDIRAALAAIEADHPATPPDPITPEAVSSRLALTFEPATVTRLLAILDRTAAFEAFAPANLDVEIPEALATHHAYTKASGRLTSTGVMSTADRDALQALPNADAGFDTAVDALFDEPATVLAEDFAGIFDDLTEAAAELLDRPAAAPVTLEQRLAYVYEHFLPVLKMQLRRGAVVAGLATLADADPPAVDLLLGDTAPLIDAVLAAGWSATYFSDATWTTDVLQRQDAAISFDWRLGAPAAVVPADNFSVRWTAHVLLSTSEPTTLVVDVAGADEIFALYVDDQLVLQKAADDAVTSLEVIVEPSAAAERRIRLDYADVIGRATIRLRARTATTGLAVIGPDAAFPASERATIAALARELDRAARVIGRFTLDRDEIAHLIAWPADFAGIDLTAPSASQLERLAAYARLRDRLPRKTVTLIDVFALARRLQPAPTVAELAAQLREATGWDEANVDFLVTTHFALGVADFRNEIALARLAAIMRIVARTGVSAQTAVTWAEDSPDFDDLDTAAQVVRRAVQASYQEQDWLELSGQLSDAIRPRQRDALTAHLLTFDEIRQWGAADADGLYEYLLIDVQMGACMDTSRVVQASAAVQQFVQRCLLNLESDTGGGGESGVAPAAIDRDRWETLRQYRLWESSRRVLVHPENWLMPEWRMDRSEFFREMESYLVQNDVTDRSVETALRTYLSRLDGVANLNVCGMHRENHDNGSLRFVHVFAHTHSAPYIFYHRTWDQYGKWSPWTRVPIDIKTTEDVRTGLGGNTGVSLVPLVWKQRVFVFWPEFTRVSESGANSTASSEDLADDSVSTLTAVVTLQIRLAWSEFVDGNWTPKSVTKEFVEPMDSGDPMIRERDFLFTPQINGATQELTMTVSNTHYNLYCGSFTLADISAPVRPQDSSAGRYVMTFPYSYEFGKRRADRRLELEGDVYFNTSTDHGLLILDTEVGLDPRINEVFFYTDRRRTYFVKPVDIWWWETIYEPSPYLDLGDYYLIPELPEPMPEWLINPPVPGFPPFGPIDPGDPIDVFDGFDGTVPPGVEIGVRAPFGMSREAPAFARAAAAPAFAMADTAMTMEIALYDAGPTIGPAFSWKADWIDPYVEIDLSILTHRDRGLEFHTFYQPYVHQYVERLNRGGVRKLLSSDTALDSDNGATFEDAYSPVFTHGFVQRPADFATRTYYKENVCFDVYGANSSYSMELFLHVPLYIATRLSREGRYEEAREWFHHIFDPTTDEPPAMGELATARYWKVLPFKSVGPTDIADWFRNLTPNGDANVENAIIADWRDHPFDPHRIAAGRPIAYMTYVVLSYVENLVAWADSLFRQFTRESVFEALQLYVMASHVLGPRPQAVPRRGTVQAESYASLEGSWDDFSNALVELENVFPYAGEASTSPSAEGPALLGVGPELYFCIPPNEKLVEHWDRVADRLYKIRHCQDIDGVERQLALFAPPIEPAALVQAAAQGLSISDVLADLSSPPPIYRFTHLMQRANEFCADVRSLGQAVLAAYERRDAEELARIQTVQESDILARVTAIRERQLLDARAGREGLLKSREAAAQRFQYYLDLLGETVTVPAPPTMDADVTGDSQLPVDTSISPVGTGADTALVDSGETGIKLIAKEKEELDKNVAAKWWTVGGNAGELLGGTFSLFPQLGAEGMPLGVGAGAWWGGQNLGAATSALARAAHGVATFLSQEAAQAATVASYIRREQEWAQQANAAAREIIALDKQLTQSDIQIQVARKELENHKRQMEHAAEIEEFLARKFTRQELHQWMIEKLVGTHKQTFTLAYELAKQCEMAYRAELGDSNASFVQFGYWDNTRKGLVAGESLQLALRRMEIAYLNNNRRERELTKTVSVLRLDPLALIELRETGRCEFSVPEEAFDLDFPGHYYRRIKSVRVSIPCVVGPYTSVGCTLRLLENVVRTNTSTGAGGGYEHDNDEGVWIDDDRFQVNQTPVTAIATSNAVNDPGLFELDFHDERLLPFEFAGAISRWVLELSPDKELRQFDYATIVDVLLHMNYTAREAGGTFRTDAVQHVKDFLENTDDLEDEPLEQLYSLRAEFPSEWHAFLHPAAPGDEQVLRFTIGAQRLPFLAQRRTVVLERVDLFARSTQDVTYTGKLTTLPVDEDDDTVTDSAEFNLPTNGQYGGLNKVTLEVTDAGLDLEGVNIGREITLQLRQAGVGDFASLVTAPAPELADIYLVLHYRLG
jgi:hypothetical protein